MRRIFLSTMIFPLFLLSFGHAFASDPINLWFPPAWAAKNDQAIAIAATLSEKTGLNIQPKIAGSYPEILDAFSGNEPSLVYAGSFIQTIIHQRGLGKVLLQSVNGKEFYAGVMIHPKGEAANVILKESPEAVAFTTGASSGETSAKAATFGKAAIGVPSHRAGAEAVASGKAKAAFVKNWWWEANKDNFPELEMTSVPGVSEPKNPDNLLTASKGVPAEAVSRIVAACKENGALFGGTEMKPFNPGMLRFSAALMIRGGMDPMTYSW